MCSGGKRKRGSMQRGRATARVGKFIYGGRGFFEVENAREVVRCNNTRGKYVCGKVYVLMEWIGVIDNDATTLSRERCG